MQYNDIKLEIYEKASKGLITPSEKDILLTSLDEEHGFYQFCEYHGLIPVDSDDFVFESIRAAIGKFMRKSFDMKVIKDKWGKMASRFTHRWKHRILDPKTKKKLSESYDVLKKEKVMYSEYKRHFQRIATTVNLPPDKIIMENVVFDKIESGQDRINVRFSKGKQQVIIPNGTCLLHVSPVDNITELKPSFRSKTLGKYMYPTPRCFFTLGKQIDPSKAGLENKTLHKYTPQETIRSAYIDPSYTDYKVGSLYVETSFPIKVIPFEEKMKRIFKESSTQSLEEVVAKYKLLIFECKKENLLTYEQASILLEYLK